MWWVPCDGSSDMPRRPRIVVEGGLYHVYNRISSGEAVFANPAEAIDFIEIINIGARFQDPKTSCSYPWGGTLAATV